MSKPSSKPKQQGEGAKRGGTSRPSKAVTIALRVREPDPATYQQRHVELQLTTNQSIALRWLLDGVRGASLENERTVQNGADVVRYLLEKVFAQI